MFFRLGDPTGPVIDNSGTAVMIAARDSVVESPRMKG
jgi:hypothetical protein